MLAVGAVPYVDIDVNPREVIVEPDVDSRILVVITAYAVWEE